MYGIRQLPWKATVGAYFVAQSGQPWETWSYEPYIALTTSTSDTNRYAEEAGSRRSDSHWQLDVNYTQNFRFGKRLNLQLLGDVYNVFDNQTGYNIEPGRPQLRSTGCRGRTSPRCGCSWPPACSSDARLTSAKARRASPPGLFIGVRS